MTRGSSKELTLYPIRCPLKEPGEGAAHMISIEVLVTRPLLKFVGGSEGAEKNNINDQDFLHAVQITS